ncbi:uncharacterized protein LOC129226802 [Uloborus diversus]|uniref:uncharacterized protein LOC129226802 n=1 Tax=Uloborus diversus TaxID=327109 RepID=UPI00240A5B2E|nr:uncharacterized protein LOC129226802 [Uloborus diversus]
MPVFRAWLVAYVLVLVQTGTNNPHLNTYTSWSDPVCLRQNYASSSFRISPGDYSVEDLTQDVCKQRCSEQRYSYAGFMSRLYCLCTDNIDDLSTEDLEKCNEYCLGNEKEICGSDDPDLIYVIEADFIGTVENITIFLEKSVFSTDEAVKISINVDASTKVLVAVDFGDGNSVVLNKEPYEIEKYYKVIGEYKIHATAFDVAKIKKPVFDEITIQIEEQHTMFKVHCPDVVKPEIESYCSVQFLSGSHLSMTFEMEDDADKESDEYEIPDPFYTFIGQPVPPFVDETSVCDASENEYFLTYIEVPHQALLFGFEYLVKKTGKFKFMVLSPVCDSDLYCEETSQCSASCSAPNLRTCSNDKVLCSYIVQCVDPEAPPMCSTKKNSFQYEVKQSFDVEAENTGYGYFNIDDADHTSVVPGDIIGFSTDGSSALWCWNVSDYESDKGIHDSTAENTLSVLHYFGAILVESNYIYLKHMYNSTGNFTVSVSVRDYWSEDAKTSSTHLPVQIPMSEVSLNVQKGSSLIGRDVSFTVVVVNGSDLTLLWNYYGKEEMEYFDKIPDGGFQKSIECSSSDDFQVTVNISNLWSSEVLSGEFHCYHPISKNWTLSSTSPKSTPPGDVKFELEFSGSKLPRSSVYAVNFGDGSKMDVTEISSDSDKWQTSFSHKYEEGGNFTVTVNISNDVDFEIFKTDIKIYAKMTNLSVVPYFVKQGQYPEDKMALKGKHSTDAPVDSTVYFENSISGYVTKYSMLSEDNELSTEASENIISHTFKKVGEWELKFVACNSEIDECGNEVELLVRILEDVSDFDFGVSSTETEVDKIIEFSIDLSGIDDYTCIMFNPGDDELFLAFHNREVCTIYYNEGEFRFIKKSSSGSSRKRRDADKAQWEDDSAINILYHYVYGGEFNPEVDVFNSVSRLKKNITVSVSDGEYQTPLVWIDDNSTDVENPLKRHRGYDFRLETTAIFRSDKSYLASHLWTVFKLDNMGGEEEIDISDLKTHNCSAIRVTKRTLEIGLYKLKYTVTVYAEDDETEENNETEDDEYEISFENRTVLAKRTVYTYLEIIPTPLIPMVIKGGASHIVRGFGQKIMLEPTVYTEDPDYPDNKEYEVTWFCVRVDKNETLTELSEHEYDTGNPSKPITDRSKVAGKKDNGGCFGKGPGLMQIGKGDYELNSKTLWTWDATYEILAVIRKDNKVAECYISVKVIEMLPPSLRLMCEKHVACFPQQKGQYINPNTFVPLKADCTENCGEGDLTFEWTIYASSFSTWEKVAIENWEAHATVDNERLGINQSLYLEYPDVKVFAVEVRGYLSDPDIPRGLSSLFLILNHPPENGLCRMNATQGMALLDIFSIEFLNWDDKDNHNIADYSIYVKYDDQFLRLSYGMKTKIMVVLPYGDLEVWCSVEDHVGGITMHSAANFSTGLPTEEELEDYESLRLFDKCLAEGKMSMASQIVIAKNSIIVEYKKRKNQTGNFAEVSEEEVDQKWLEFLDLDGIDSSYFTPQAKDEIREMLTEILEKQQDAETKVKNKEVSKLLRLPMEALPDAEIFGGALSAVAENGPSDLTGKLKIMQGMDNMFNVINVTEVPHPENKKIVFSQFGNLADSIAGSLAESNIGGHFLPAELKKAEEELDYNATEPNYFIFYVEGNRKEVQERLKDRAVDAAKEEQASNSKEMVTKIKDMISSIQEECMEDLMVGPEPFYAESRSGFQMTFLKNFASELSGSSIQQGGSTIILPDICNILNKQNCKDDALGIQTVRWTQPLESYGANSANLSEYSNVLQVEITSREGNASIPISDANEFFLICIPYVGAKNGENEMEYIVPEFQRDDDILVYHTIFVESSGTTVIVNLKPDNPSAPLIVLYKYGEQPSLLDYDDILPMQDIASTDGIHSLYIGAKVITDGGKNLSIAIGHLSNTTNAKLFFENQDKYNLSVVNMTNKFSSNYSIKISTTGCYYFSESEEKWSTDGCQVVSSASGVTCCECNHLTSFSSGFFVTPSEIDFSYVFANAGFKNNVTIYATIIVTLSVFILLLIYARWRDRKDLQKLGATPLPDNEASDKYIYEILVFTGHQRNAGTKSNVFFIVSGEDDETEVRHLADDKRPILQKGSVDVFVMSVSR